MFNWFRFTVCLSPDLCFNPTVHYFNATRGNYKITDMFSIGGTKGRELFFVSLKTRIFVTYSTLFIALLVWLFAGHQGLCLNSIWLQKENKTEQLGIFKNFNRRIESLYIQALCCNLELPLTTMILHRPCLSIA